MNPEEQLIKSIVRDALKGNFVQIGDSALNNINWPNFRDLMAHHELGGVVYTFFKDNNISLPQDLAGILKATYYNNLVRGQKFWKEFLCVQDAFEAAGVSILPIKGLALLNDIYFDMPVRPMVDLDVLVKQSDIAKANELLQALGYVKNLEGLKEGYWLNDQYHLVYQGNGFILELHWAFDCKRQGRLILPEVWDRVQEVQVDGRQIKMLSPEDELFCLTLHTRHFGKVFCLKYIYDIALLINKYKDSFDWDYVLSQSRKYRISSSLYFMLYQVKLLTDSSISEVTVHPPEESAGVITSPEGAKQSDKKIASSLSLLAMTQTLPMAKPLLPEYVWKGLGLHFWKKWMISSFIKKNIFLADAGKKMNNLYLRAHFLLYNNLLEPVWYIINIPKEQFAKFYGLNAYAAKTNLLYRWRVLYFVLKVFKFSGET